MNQVFDIIEAINEKTLEYFYTRSQKPATRAVSPYSYRRLIEIKSLEEATENLILDCAAMREVVTRVGKVNIVIDEMLPDDAIQME